MTEKKARLILGIFGVALTGVLGVFIWIIMNADSSSMSTVLRNSILLVGGVTAVSQIIYALKGNIFEFDGRLAKREVLFSIICFQCIMQFGFGFSLYAVNQTTLHNDSYDSAYVYFSTLQQLAEGNTVEDYRNLNDIEIYMPECIEGIYIIDGESAAGTDKYFRFPIKGGMILMEKSQSYFNRHLRSFAVDLLMSLVISVLMMIEVVYFATKLIDERVGKERAHVVTRGEPPAYLRQLAFLFYFSGFLGSSIVPIIARNLCGDNPNANFIAGLPYSVEALANCAAILLVTPIFRKKGWKPPYIIGIGVFTIGLLSSAIVNDIYLFILARAVAGVGYGFCWMTLRNITTISGDRAINFSSLTSGIFAGIMCGVAFGAVLADKIGYSNVLLISAVLCAVSSIFPINLENGKNSSETAKVEKVNLSPRDILVLSIFLLTIVMPTCISESFCDYVSPLYINELGLPTAYAGRISLLYNLCIVYLSSNLFMNLVQKLVKSLLLQNVLHMTLVSIALLAAAYFGGFQAMLIASAILGSADGFGFSVQNAYVLDTQVSKKIGSARMLTYFSLFKKFGAMLGPITFSFFMGGGVGRLGLMGVAYIVLMLTGVALLSVASKKTSSHKASFPK